MTQWGSVVLGRGNYGPICLLQLFGRVLRVHPGRHIGRVDGHGGLNLLLGLGHLVEEHLNNVRIETKGLFSFFG